MIYEANQKNFIIAAGTSGGSDSTKNRFGIANGHGYSLMSAFYLRDPSGNIVHRMYMIRNPWSVSSYIGNFNSRDARWTSDYLA